MAIKSKLGPPAVLLLAAMLLSLACGCPRHVNDDGRKDSEVIVMSNLINTELKKIRKEVESLSKKIEGLYERQDEIAAKSDKGAYRTASNGTFYKIADDGGSALWISDYVPITEDVMKAAYFTEPLDKDFKEICLAYPDTVQVYYNDRNCLNRIYPWFDVLSQYQPKMNIPEFNFYYLADESHNPERCGVWVKEPYIDPAGRGWIISAIAPAYWNNRLEGVCGIDITLETITSKFFEKKTGIYAIFTESGTLVSAMDKAMSIMQMPPLSSPKYVEAVNKDLYMQETYNITRSRQKNIRGLGTELIQEKLTKTVFVSIDGVKYNVYSAKILELDWLLIEFIP